MSPKFEFDEGQSIEIDGTVIVNPAGGVNDGEDDDTDVFLPQGTLQKAVEEITDLADSLRSVSLKSGEPPENLLVNGIEHPSVVIPLGHNVVVHSS